MSPSLLAGRLRQTDGRVVAPYPINVVRPPLALDGGDFFTDGKGVGFTSTETLRINGGNVELVNQVLQDYLGVKEVVYLLPLPGSTVKHIDMFFKPVSETILLLGKYDNAGTNIFSTALQAEAQRVLSYNLRILKDFYKNRRDRQNRKEVNVVDGETGEIKSDMVNIVLVPMPELQRPHREKIAKTEQELNTLMDRYDQYHQSYETALENSESLNDSLEYSNELRESLKAAILKLRGTPVSTEVIRVSDLLDSSSDVIAEIETFYEDRFDVSDSSLKEKLKIWNALTQYLDSKPDVRVEELAVDDKEILRGLLNEAATALGQFIGTLRIDHAKAKDDAARHSKDMKRVLSDAISAFSEWEKLQERFPYGSDLYRTYLNALQIKTSQGNVLMTPVYRGLNQMEIRVQNIFRRVYTYAYGDVTLVPVESDYFIQLSGSIHCLTQAIPVELDVFQDDWNFRSKLSPKP